MILSNGRAAVARIARTAARTNLTANRGFVSATQMVLEKHITKVPTMGDSITEVSHVTRPGTKMAVLVAATIHHTHSQ